VNLEERANELGRTAWLRDAAWDALLELAGASHVEHCARGQTLFLEGNAAEYVVVLCSGFARSHRSHLKRDLTVDTHGPRSALGVAAAFLEPTRYAVSAEMLEAGAVLRVDSSAVRALCEHDARFAALTLRHVARRHQQLTERLSQLQLRDLDARLAALLLEHASTEPWALPTNSRLAADLGTVPELVSRKLGEFYRREWISLERRCVRVTDSRALAGLLDD
jgi:CRP/FNR family transcriptional regulator